MSNRIISLIYKKNQSSQDDVKAQEKLIDEQKNQQNRRKRIDNRDLHIENKVISFHFFLQIGESFKCKKNN
jgi:hypothetical protein